MTDPLKPSDMLELKPCPFCGQDPNANYEYADQCVVSCSDPDCIGIQITTAIECWNTRADLVEQPAKYCQCFDFKDENGSYKTQVCDKCVKSATLDDEETVTTTWQNIFDMIGHAVNEALKRVQPAPLTDNTGKDEWCNKCGGSDKNCNYGHIPLKQPATVGEDEFKMGSGSSGMASVEGSTPSPIANFTDDEVREAVKVIEGWLWLVEENTDTSKKGFTLYAHDAAEIRTLIRAATAAKSCDNQHLIDLAERTAKTNTELRDKCDKLVQALEYASAIFNEEGMTISEQKCEKALAEHRATEGKI